MGPYVVAFVEDVSVGCFDRSLLGFGSVDSQYTCFIHLFSTNTVLLLYLLTITIIITITINTVFVVNKTSLLTIY